MQLSVNTSLMRHPPQQLNLEQGKSGHHFRSDGSLPAFAGAGARRQDDARSWWKKWQVSDRCLEEREVEGVRGWGGGRSAVAGEVQRSATGKEMPGREIDAPWWHWQADVTQVRGQSWGDLPGSSQLLLDRETDRCTERRLRTGDDAIMCVHLHKQARTHTDLWSQDNRVKEQV